jgi:hypothetical protein
VFGTTFTGPLSRAHVSFAAMWAGETAFMVALAVVAFQNGGASEVGVVTAIRMAAAAVVSPFVAAIAGRVRRERVLNGIGVVRAATLAGAVVVTGIGGPPAATYNGSERRKLSQLNFGEGAADAHHDAREHTPLAPRTAYVLLCGRVPAIRVRSSSHCTITGVATSTTDWTPTPEPMAGAQAMRLRAAP